MMPLRHLFVPPFLVYLSCGLSLSAQTAQNGAWLRSPAIANSATSKFTPSQHRTQDNLDPQQSWPSPVDDRERYTFILADVLEYRPQGRESDFRWDIEGWHGGDFNRLWFKSEGEQNTAFKAEYDIDAQLMYGRFIRKYYDFQVGLRAETQSYQGRNVTRAHAVVGLEGLVPYRYDFESALFISQHGDISGRVSFTRDLLVTQRLILQPRFESNIAAQRVERFTMGRGLNNIEFGLRLRYEIRRKFGPYAGISFDRSFFGTADLVRQEGGDPGQIRFVVGLRMWR